METKQKSDDQEEKIARARLEVACDAFEELAKSLREGGMPAEDISGALLAVYIGASSKHQDAAVTARHLHVLAVGMAQLSARPALAN